jgi:hypothetical protein
MPDQQPVMPDLIGHPWIPVFTGMTMRAAHQHPVMPDQQPVMPDLIGHPWSPAFTAITAEPFKRYP